MRSMPPATGEPTCVSPPSLLMMTFIVFGARYAASLNSALFRSLSHRSLVLRRCLCSSRGCLCRLTRSRAATRRCSPCPCNSPASRRSQGVTSHTRLSSRGTGRRRLDTGVRRLGMRRSNSLRHRAGIPRSSSLTTIKARESKEEEESTTAAYGGGERREGVKIFPQTTKNNEQKRFAATSKRSRSNS